MFRELIKENEKERLSHPKTIEEWKNRKNTKNKLESLSRAEINQ